MFARPASRPSARLPVFRGRPCSVSPRVGRARKTAPLSRRLIVRPPRCVKKGCACAPAEPDALNVVAWVLPQTAATRRDSRRETVFPPERWVRSRYYGEMGNDALRRHVVSVLAAEGIDAVAPIHCPAWAGCDSTALMNRDLRSEGASSGKVARNAPPCRTLWSRSGVSARGIVCAGPRGAPSGRRESGARQLRTALQAYPQIGLEPRSLAGDAASLPFGKRPRPAASGGPGGVRYSVKVMPARQGRTLAPRASRRTANACSPVQ